MPNACPWFRQRLRCRIGCLLRRRSVRAAGVVIGLAAGSTSTLQAQTVNDFDSPGTPYIALPCVRPPNFVPTVMPGGPTGNFLRLASSPAPNSNTISFPQTNAGIFPVIVADFDFRITPTNGRADGLGFALLNTAHYPAGGVCPELPPYVPDEPHFTNSLGIGFDIYQSIHPGTSGADLNNNHVSIHFNATEQAEIDVPLVDLASSRWIHAQITFRQGVSVTVILTPQGGQPVIVADRYPLTFGAYEARVLLGARSGGLTGDHDIDNVRVQFLEASATLLSFEASDRPGETDSSALVTVTRAGNTSGSVQVQYTTADGTAHAGLDYTPAAGPLSFGPNETSKSFQVPILNDTLNEGDEYFSVNLANPSAGAAIVGPPATIAIVDDERARQAGVWSSIFGTEIVAVHLHHLPDGTVLLWSGAGEGSEHAFDNPRVWNPATGLIESVPFPHNLFCSGHAFLQDGRLLVTGGHESLMPPGPIRRGLSEAAIYNPRTKSWTPIERMNAGRWYPTNTTLANGGVLVTGGEIIGPDPDSSPPLAALINEISQVWDRGSTMWRTLTGARFPWPLYPFMFLAPNGQVFNAGPNQDTRYVNTDGTGLLTGVATSSRYRADGSAVLYDNGKVLVIGGADATDIPTSTSEVIDLNLPDPTWRSLTSTMASARRYGTATILPDGAVLVTGGTRLGGFNNGAGAILEAELWDPVTESWTTLAPMDVKRVYHSTAMLLKDGRVLVAGGGQPAPEHGIDNRTAQIFSPPYLFKGPRPTIASAPPVVKHGQPFSIVTPDAATITAVNWIRLPSVTHAFNQNQRINRLTFAQTSGRLDVTAPVDARLAPPGHYMLFILGPAAVPSVASIVKLVEPFTDDPLMPGTTPIKAVHITELRTRIDAVRAGYALQNYAYVTDPIITPTITTIKAQHIIELREALRQAYDAASQPPPIYSTGPGAVVMAADIEEIRQRVNAIE